MFPQIVRYHSSYHAIFSNHVTFLAFPLVSLNEKGKRFWSRLSNKFYFAFLITLNTKFYYIFFKFIFQFFLLKIDPFLFLGEDFERSIKFIDYFPVPIQEWNELLARLNWHRGGRLRHHWSQLCESEFLNLFYFRSLFPFIF